MNELAEELVRNGFTIEQILEECGMDESDALAILLPHLTSLSTLPPWLEEMVERNNGTNSNEYEDIY